eukprot:4104798-Amphidinium_carterae.2
MSVYREPGAQPPTALALILPFWACPSRYTVSSNQQLGCWYTPSMTGFLANPTMARSSQIWRPVGRGVRLTRLSPLHPMAIAHQSRYFSTGEPWRQYSSPASGGPVKGAKSSTIWSCSNHDFPGTQ